MALTLAQVLQELREDYCASLPERLATLRTALAHEGDQHRQEARRVGHKLKGTARTVGLDPIGHVGAAIERFCDAAAWDEHSRARLQGAAALLDDLAVRARNGEALDADAVARDPRLRALDAP